MSNAEFERFSADLAADAEMRAAAKTAATGLAAIVAFATERGYAVTLEDATTYIKARASRGMSEEEMDAIAGGNGPEVAVIAQVHTAVDVSAQVVATAMNNENAVAVSTSFVGAVVVLV